MLGGNFIQLLKVLTAILILISCSGEHKQPIDNYENLKLVWRNQHFDWITSSVSIKDKHIYFGSFNDSVYLARLKDGKIIMKFKTGDDPYFQPIINKNRLYFTSFDLNLYCTDTLGNLIWKVPFSGRIKNDLLEDDSSIFVSVRNNGLWKVRKRDGKTVWHLSQNSLSLTTSQPIILKDKIYIGMWTLDNQVLAVNKYSGKIIWSNSYPEFASSDPALAPNGLLVTIDKFYKGGYVKMLDYNSGKEIWSTPLKCEALFKPYTDSNNIIVSTYDYKVVCLNNLNGKIKWSLTLSDTTNHEVVDGGFAAFNHKIYFSTIHRNLYCVDINTGKVIFIEKFTYGFAEPIVTNKKIYFPTGGSELWTLKD